MFLSATELQELTGYKRPADQRRWLVSHGWSFEIRADGKNIVLIEEARNRLLTRKSSSRSTEPDLDALRALG